jgi:23S rRNA pseudouridine1911/1915/1917 synthase
MSTLLDHLLIRYPLAKRTTLRRMIEDGRVRINGKPARTLKQPLNAEDQVSVADRAAPPPAPPPRLPFAIVHEDEQLIVIDKPAGLLTSTGPREKRPTALAMIRAYVAATDAAAQVGLIHRLDRDASGLLVFSKRHEAYLSLKRQFFERTAGRVYLALVHHVPNPRSGSIDSLLLERADGSVRPTDDPRKGERAITHYETIRFAADRALLRVKLQTGKKHQIRAHLAARGVPIINDPVYCDVPPAGRLMLAAVALSIRHPLGGGEITFSIDPPFDLDPAGHITSEPPDAPKRR